MGSRLLDELGTIAAGIIGLAVIAVIVSKNSSTGDVLTSAGKSFASIISAAVKPAS